ncbi:MAG: hypothetical protein ACLTFB_02660 [Candidatus Phytoplasma pyri]
MMLKSKFAFFQKIILLFTICLLFVYYLFLIIKFLRCVRMNFQKELLDKHKLCM